MELRKENTKNKLYCSCNCKYEEEQEVKPLLNGFTGEPYLINQLDNDIYTKNHEFFICIEKNYSKYKKVITQDLQEFSYMNFLTLVNVYDIEGFVIVTFRCNEIISHFSHKLGGVENEKI